MVDLCTLAITRNKIYVNLIILLYVYLLYLQVYPGKLIVSLAASKREFWSNKAITILRLVIEHFVTAVVDNNDGEGRIYVTGRQTCNQTA